MRILITGSNGLLGHKLVYKLAGRNDIELFATSLGENRISLKTGYQYIPLDITKRDEVQRAVNNARPDCIINTAAMTNVDACEKDKEGCRALNIDAVTYLLEAGKAFNAHFIHLSTDFVFDGENGP